MRSTGKCPKCGSSAIIAGARMVDRGQYNAKMDLQAAVYDKPEAFIFKGEHTFTINAWICPQCGFTELYSTPGK